MHIYANPSRVPVVLIEQHVMIVPQHGCSKDLLANAQDPNNIVPPNLQEDSVTGNPSGGKNSGHVLRAVIFVHGFQVSFFGLVHRFGSSWYKFNWKFCLCQKTGASSGSLSYSKSMAFA
jgi:hypothetical protein